MCTDNNEPIHAYHIHILIRQKNIIKTVILFGHRHMTDPNISERTSREQQKKNLIFFIANIELKWMLTANTTTTLLYNVHP